MAKQPIDPYAQRAKRLASEAQRLKGWVGTDPSKVVPWLDALIALTAHRLIGHAYADAAAEAQEAVVATAKQLATHGPIGPYTPVPDAARSFTAMVHVATVQSGLGLGDAAGRTIQAATAWKAELPAGLDAALDPRTAVWALAGMATDAQAAGDFEQANACADAALARLTEAGLDAEALGFLSCDVWRLRSDCRWAAGLADEAVASALVAVEVYEQVARPLAEPGRLPPAMLERLSEPAFTVFRDAADRLVARGEADLGRQVRRRGLALLTSLIARRGDVAAAQAALTGADLAHDLMLADRLPEAELVAAEAASVASGLAGSLRETTDLLVLPVLAEVLTRLGRAEDALAALEPVLLAVVSRDEASAADLLVLAGFAQAQRAAGATTEAEATTRGFDEAAQPLLAGVNWVALGAVDIDTLVRDRARGVVTRAAHLTPSWAPLSEAASFAAATAASDAERQAAADAVAAMLAGVSNGLADRRREAAEVEAELFATALGEAERLSAARAEEERLAAEQAHAARVAAERAEAERVAAEQAEAERVAAEQEAARLERKRQRELRIEEHRLAAERAEAERLAAEQAQAPSEPIEPEILDPEEAERLELERLAAELAELEREENARLEAELLELERLAAEQAAADQAAAEEAARLEAERIAAEHEAALRREAEMRAAEAAAREEAERVAAAEAARAEAERIEAERLEAERAEAERRAVEQAARAEAERVEAERVEAERLEAERLEAERVEAERQEAERLQVVEAERPEAQPPAPPSVPSELETARAAFEAARDSGDRRHLRDAAERLTEVLRPLADADLAGFGPELIDTLEALAKARWQTGDLWGSRAPAKEAKALGKLLGR